MDCSVAGVPGTSPPSIFHQQADWQGPQEVARLQQAGGKRAGEVSPRVGADLLHPFAERDVDDGRELVDVDPAAVAQLEPRERRPASGDEVVDQHRAAPSGAPTHQHSGAPTHQHSGAPTHASVPCPPRQPPCRRARARDRGPTSPAIQKVRRYAALLHAITGVTDSPPQCPRKPASGAWTNTMPRVQSSPNACHKLAKMSAG
eukprot:gene5817-biopygen9637